MAQVTTFDTLMYAKKLRETGVPENQAEVQAEALKELIENNLASKRDLDELEQRLTYKLTLRMGTMIAAAVVTLSILITILSKVH